MKEAFYSDATLGSSLLPPGQEVLGITLAALVSEPPISKIIVTSKKEPKHRSTRGKILATTLCSMTFIQWRRNSLSTKWRNCRPVFTPIATLQSANFSTKPRKRKFQAGKSRSGRNLNCRMSIAGIQNGH